MGARDRALGLALVLRGVRLVRVWTSMGTLMHWVDDPGYALRHFYWNPGTPLGKHPVWYGVEEVS